MTKEEFIEACNKQMKNITDPKRVAARCCRAGAKSYAILKRKAEMKKRRPRNG